MGAKQEKYTKEVRQAGNFLAFYQGLFEQPSMVVPMLKPDDRQDQWLAVAIALRGKPYQEYLSIVRSLSIAEEKEINPEKKKILSDLCSKVHEMGVRDFGELEMQ